MNVDLRTQQMLMLPVPFTLYGPMLREEAFSQQQR
jgi:hypothetical protein